MNERFRQNGEEEPDEDYPDVEPDEQTVFVADNVSEYVERTRHQQILDSRQKAKEAVKRSEEMKTDLRRNGMSRAEAKRTAQRSVRSAVESYILDCERLFQRTTQGQTLWLNTEIASAPVRDFFSVSVDGGFQEIKSVEIVGDTPVRVTHTGSAPSSIVLTFGGMRDYIDFGNPRVKYEYTVTVSRRGNPTREKEGTATLSTPVYVSREAFRATNALVGELLAGIDVGSANNEVGGDYSDILDKIDDE